jgi:hypothetical protein
MAILYMNSSEFCRFASTALQAALDGPAFIAEGGEPSHLLLSIHGYRKLPQNRIPLAQALAQDDEAEPDFEAAKLRLEPRDPCS